MTRNEIKAFAKRSYIAILIALPIIIGLDVLIQGKVKLWLMVLIDMILMGAAILIGQVIYDKRKKKLQEKKQAKAEAAKNVLKSQKTEKHIEDIDGEIKPQQPKQQQQTLSQQRKAARQKSEKQKEIENGQN